MIIIKTILSNTMSSHSEIIETIDNCVFSNMGQNQFVDGSRISFTFRSSDEYNNVLSKMRLLSSLYVRDGGDIAGETLRVFIDDLLEMYDLAKRDNPMLAEYGDLIDRSQMMRQVGNHFAADMERRQRIVPESEKVACGPTFADAFELYSTRVLNNLDSIWSFMYNAVFILIMFSHAKISIGQTMTIDVQQYIGTLIVYLITYNRQRFVVGLLTEGADPRNDEIVSSIGPNGNPLKEFVITKHGKVYFKWARFSNTVANQQEYRKMLIRMNCADAETGREQFTYAFASHLARNVKLDVDTAQKIYIMLQYRLYLETIEKVLASTDQLTSLRGLVQPSIIYEYLNGLLELLKSHMN